MRLVLITFHFPPSSAIGAARMFSLAQYLASRGHEVNAIHANVPPVADDRSDAFGAISRIPVEWFDVLRPWRGLSAGARASWSISDSMESGVAKRSKLRSFILKQVHPRVSSFYRSFVAFPDVAVGWIPFALRVALRDIRVSGATAIVSSGPPFSAHVVASIVSRITGVPWLADFRDPWTQGRYYPFGPVRRKSDRYLERCVLAGASVLTTVSPPLVAELASLHGNRVSLVMNGYDHLERLKDDSPPLSDAALNILYVGRSFYGGERSPSRLFRSALRLGLTESQMRIHFLGARHEDVMIFEGANEVKNLLVFHDEVGAEESRRMQERAGALLLLLREDSADAGTYSGKLFEYIGAGRPVVLIGYEDGVAAELLRTSKLGYVPRTDQELDKLLQDLVGIGDRRLVTAPEARSEFERKRQNEIFERLAHDL